MAKDLVAAETGQLEEAVIGEDDGMVRDESVHEDHRHPRLFGGDYERAAFLPKALDLAFGSLLDIGLIWHPEDNTN